MLHPPFKKIKGIQFTSWANSRLPDQIWIALLMTHLDRTLAIDAFRQVAIASQGSFVSGNDIDITLTGLAKLPIEHFETIMNIIFSADGADIALSPLLLFEDLPGRDRWIRFIKPHSEISSWEILARTIALTLWHQSEEATDVRWAKVLFKVAAGQLHLQTEEQFLRLAEYPTFGDIRETRPFVRALENGFNPESDYTEQNNWASSFWLQCLKRTPCGNSIKPKCAPPKACTSRMQINQIGVALTETYNSTISTTENDTRHLASFGLVQYANSIVTELLGIGVSQGILGRLGLRSILESYITLGYLAKVDDPAEWEAYRIYGQGQAKLAMLKVDDFESPPSFVSSGLLEQIASEDRSPEFVSINIGHWANVDCRRLSQEADLKESYDQFYPWSSAFIHGNWGSVRTTTMSTCGNPLHRLHSTLQPVANHLDDVIPDCCEMLDSMIEILEQLHNVSLPRASQNA